MCNSSKDTEYFRRLHKTHLYHLYDISRTNHLRVILDVGFVGRKSYGAVQNTLGLHEGGFYLVHTGGTGHPSHLQNKGSVLLAKHELPGKCIFTSRKSACDYAALFIALIWGVSTVESNNSLGWKGP